MPKIFGIGLSKTGTTSLCEALRILGYSVVDFPERPAQIAGRDAATDTSVSYQFERLDRLYPGSRFIYTVRERDAWLRSCAAFWAIHAEHIPTQPVLVEVFISLYGTAQFDRDKFSAAYGAHEQRVLDYFKDRPENLLTLDICGAPGWTELCRFLEAPVPEASFPHSNSITSVQWRARQRRLWYSIRPFLPKFLRPVIKPHLKKPL